MGIASRTKWQRRASNPAVIRRGVKRARVVDQAKLAHRIDVTNTRNVAMREAAVREAARWTRYSLALDTEKAKNLRRRQNKAQLGWRPHAQR